MIWVVGAYALVCIVTEIRVCREWDQAMAERREFWGLRD